MKSIHVCVPLAVVTSLDVLFNYVRQESGQSLSPQAMEQFIQAFSEAGNMEVVKEAWELMKQMGLQPSQVIFFCTCHSFSSHL